MRPQLLAAAAAAIALAAAAATAAKPAHPPAHAAPAATPAAAPPAADAPAPVPSSDASLTDIRCIVVAAALSASEDPQLKSLARASLFYYVGRLQGRGDTDGLNARIVQEATKMTGDQINAQAKTCSGMLSSAAQGLEDLSKAFAEHFGRQGGSQGGGQGAGAAGGAAPPK